MSMGLKSPSYKRRRSDHSLLIALAIIALDVATAAIIHIRIEGELGAPAGIDLRAVTVIEPNSLAHSGTAFGYVGHTFPQLPHEFGCSSLIRLLTCRCNPPCRGKSMASAYTVNLEKESFYPHGIETDE
jgi:hypothetical protein